MRPMLAAAVIAIAISGCTEARLLNEQEAYAYCHTHPAGSTFGMNPFGEEYSTWMSYCNQAWTQQMMPGLATSAGILQRQEEINRMQPTRAPVSCYQMGNVVTCQ